MSLVSVSFADRLKVTFLRIYKRTGWNSPSGFFSIFINALINKIRNIKNHLYVNEWYDVGTYDITLFKIHSKYQELFT